MAKENAKRGMGKLDEREIALGGDELCHLRFKYNENPSYSFNVLVYAATPQNSLYFGPETSEQLALQVATARGHSGLNVEYLVRLADFMREKVPHHDEEHLFELEKSGFFHGGYITLDSAKKQASRSSKNRKPR